MQQRPVVNPLMSPHLLLLKAAINENPFVTDVPKSREDMATMNATFVGTSKGLMAMEIMIDGCRSYADDLQSGSLASQVTEQRSQIYDSIKPPQIVSDCQIHAPAADRALFAYLKRYQRWFVKYIVIR